MEYEQRRDKKFERLSFGKRSGLTDVDLKISSVRFLPLLIEPKGESNERKPLATLLSCV